MSSLQGSDVPPSLEAANQAQIDDLVQRNRGLEYLNNKLNEKLSAEANRSKEAVHDFQKRWHEKELSLLEEFSALESERMNVLNEQKALREEKLLRLQRDFRIAIFDAKERELEERVVELEEENEKMVSERRELALALQKKVPLILAQLRTRDVEINNMSLERDLAEKDIMKLNEKNAQLQTSLASTSSKLERVSLQLEDVQSSRSELEGINEDLKHKNHDLECQIDKWKRLEHGGDAELDALRQRKSELEAETEELRERLSREKEILTKKVEKEQKRVEQLEETVLTWKKRAEMHQREVKDTREELTEYQKELEKLKAVQTSDGVNSSKVKKTVVSKPSATGSEIEKAKRDAPSLRRKKGTTSESESDEVIILRPSRKQRKMSPVVEENEDSREVVNEKEKEVEVTKPKPRPKPRTKEEKPMLPSAPSSTTINRRKRKASTDDSGEESDMPDRKMVNIATKPGRSRITHSTSKKLSKRATSEDSVVTAVDPLPKTRKQKINIFAGTGTQSNKLKFDFSSGANDFNIPTSLTPVKEVEGPVPNRTVSGLTSGLGITGLLRDMMGGTR